MRFLLSLFLVLASSRGLHGQGTSTQTGGRIVSQRSIGKSISDPNNQLSLASFLTNESVAKEIGIDAEQRPEVRKLLDASGGSLSIGVIHGDRTTIKKMTKEEVQTLFAKQRLERESSLSEIVDPNQLRRLKEVAYQIEIARVGMGEALTNGFLGAEIGVEVYQKSALKIVADAAELRASEAILKVRALSLEALLSELSSSQSEVLKDRLGKGFRFREDPKTFRYEYKSLSASGKLYAIPDPTSLLAVVGLTMNKSVADELTLGQDERDAIRQLHKDARSPIAAAIIRSGKVQSTEELRMVVEKIVGVARQKRLSQIAHQIEVARVGFDGALTNGYLGRELGLDKIQRNTLEAKSKRLGEEEREGIKLITNSERAEVLNELLPLQRDKALSLLGRVFLFEEEAVSSRD